MRRIQFAVAIDYEARSISADDVEQAILLALGDRNAVERAIVVPVGKRLFESLSNVPAANASDDFVALARWHLGQMSDEQYADHLLDRPPDDPMVKMLANRLRIARQLDEPWDDPARTGAKECEPDEPSF